MKDLVLELAMDGYEISFTEGGFALRTAISVSLSRLDTEGTRVYRDSLVPYTDFHYLESIIRQMRADLNSFILGN